MNLRPLLVGLTAAASITLPALAAPLPAATAGLLPVAQSAYYSIRSTQDLLNRLGYDAGTVDGVMGNRTRGAVMAYQQDQGLAVTGQPDATLYAHMLNTHNRGGGAPAQPATTLVDSDVVVEVQAGLRRRGYSIPSVSGQFDEPTRSAIISYQRAVGLPVTGTIDSALVASLRGAEGGAAPVATDRALVRDVQQALVRRGYDPGATDGLLSSETAAAIRTYEADHGLPITGAASQRLLARLESGATTTTLSERQTVMSVQEELIARGYLKGKADGMAGVATSAAIRAFEQDAGLPVTGAPSTSLLASLRASDLTRKEADRQRRVAEAERLLAERGYPVGPADGVKDAQTEAAIRAFERDAGLPIDGRLDDRTIEALRSSNVTAGPPTPEEALQGIIQEGTIRLLEGLGN